MASRSCTFLEILLAIILPPLGVFLHYGCCSVSHQSTPYSLSFLFPAAGPPGLRLQSHSVASHLVGSPMEFCICLLLTILGYIPGIIYAVYVLVALDRDEPQREYYAVA
ncbi:hypothetical protein ACQ4PT_072275 [Festuca glaucescens]